MQPADQLPLQLIVVEDSELDYELLLAILIREGLLLRPAAQEVLFPPTTIDHVVGSARYKGPALSDRDIAQALDKKARQWRR